MMKVGDYFLINSLGKGSYGEVYLAKKETNLKKYAIKKIPIDILNENKGFEKYLNNEINIMKQLNHENIIKLHDIIKTGRNLYLVMDYINGGSLSECLTNYKLKRGEPFPQKLIQYFVKQIVKALIYIHSKDIIHRDLKLDNILLDFDPTLKEENRDLYEAKIKIIDFGLSTKMIRDENKKKQLAKTIVGTPLFMDPILLQKYDKKYYQKQIILYDEKCDIWSLGAITYEMLTGENLFKAYTLKDLKSKVEKGNYYLQVKDLYEETLSFLNCMLQYEPQNRLSALELSDHQFLKNNVEMFQKADVSSIEYKINDGILTLNIINNKTIAEKFPYKPNILTMNLDKMTEISNDSSLNESTENQKLIKNITSISQIPQDETKYIPLSITPNNDNKEIKKNVVKIQNSLNESNHKIYPVKFEVKRIDNKKENAHLNISLVVNEKSTFKEESDLKVENDFFYEWIWKFDNNDWKNVDINSENFMMEIIYKDTKNTKIFNHQIESIKLGNPIDFSFENIINLTLTPMDEIINC